MKKTLFLNNLALLFIAREKILDRFKNRLFPIKELNKILTLEQTPEPVKEPAT